MTRYVALLRGINLGKRQIKMDALRRTFEQQGYTDVKTLLASGNVVFAAEEASAETVRAKIETTIKEGFGFDVHVILRSAKEIQALVDSEPFKGVKVTPETRLYITFLSKPPKAATKALAGKHGIRAVAKTHVVSGLSGTDKTTDHMDLLVKEFGANITTRNWNTVMKIHAALQGK